MRLSAAKTVSILAVAAVGVLGVQYAGAAPRPVPGPAAASTNGTTSTNGGTLAQPNVAPVRNLAYMDTTSTAGGTGQVAYTIPNPPSGFYAASFTANFNPQGTPAAPETFSCSLIKGGLILRAQSTASTTYDSGFYAGVNGGNTIHVTHDDTWQVLCGTNDIKAWTWGSRPVQVTLTRLDGQITGSLSGGTPQKGSLVGTTGR